MNDRRLGSFIVDLSDPTVNAQSSDDNNSPHYELIYEEWKILTDNGQAYYILIPSLDDHP